MSQEYKIPRIFTVSDIHKFLKEVEDIFTIKNACLKDVKIDFKEVEKIDVIGLLLIYKLIEYAIENKCLIKPELDLNPYIEKKLAEYGFDELLHDYTKCKTADYTNLDFRMKGEFYIAPLALLREQNYSDEIIENKFLPKIEEYYVDRPKASLMILQCLSEVLLNFWEHAVNDTKSILVASGNKDYVEIVCADTGNGIISNLSPVLNGQYSKSEIIEKSLERGVTSKKKTDHMGCGLWILNQIVTLAKGRLSLYSEGAFIKNDFGSVSMGQCAYWQGTIIHVFLPMSSPKILSDIKELIKEEFEDININFK